jgi:hypothetical protein
MTLSQYHSAYALGGVEGVLLELIEEAQRYAAQQHPAVDNRSLYAFAADLKYRVRASETLTNTKNNEI